MATKKEVLMTFMKSSKTLECLKKKKAKLKQEEHAKDSFMGKTKEDFKAFMKDHTEKVKAYINKNSFAEKGEKLADDIMQNYAMYLESDGKRHKMKSWGKHLICCLTKVESKTRSEILDEFHFSESTANKVLSKLNYKGLIDITDAENPVISLTEKGKEIGKKIEAHLEEVSEKLLNNFNDKEVDNLAMLLDKLQENIRTELNDVKKKLAENTM